MTSTPQAWLLLSGIFATVATLVLLTTLIPAASGARSSAVVRSTDVSALLIAALAALLFRRLPTALLHPAIFAGSALVSACVYVSGGGSTALAYSAVCLLSPLYCRFVLPPRGADVQFLLMLATGVPVLATRPGIGPGEVAVLWGVACMEYGAVTWLVNALAAAEHDTLTGLLNRKGVERALGEAIGATAAEGRLGLVVLEMDRFRLVNETLGRPAGDQVLQSSARDWVESAPAGATIGRISGDGFAVVLPGADLGAVAAVADAMRAAGSSPLGISAGAVGWEPGEAPSTLLARAEAAVQVAKQQGRGRTTTDVGTGAEGRELRRALTQGEFVVWFQPIVDLGTHRTTGAEALVRWQHPTRGLLAPADFLDRVEGTGLMVDLGQRVLVEACEAAASWRDQPGRPAPYVSVNASSSELQDPTYATRVRQALQRSGLPPERLVIELVESQYESESVDLLSNLHGLREIGVRTALDDFGVGYSSLDRLRRLTSDILKIDKSFVDDIVAIDQEVPLVRAVLAMSAALRLRVIAEGVEHPVQADWLARHGCDAGQGWLFGQPQPGEAFTRSLDGSPAPRQRRAH